MAEQRIVQTAFWRDEYVSNLDKLERFFFLYLLTNPYTNIAGVYQLGIKYIVLETGFSEKEILAMFERFEKDGKVRYDGWWIAVKNWLKHQKHGSLMIKKGIEKYLARAPKWCQEYVTDKGYWYPLTLESELELQSELELEITSEEVTADPPPEKKWDENVAITEIIAKLKSDLGIPDFKEDVRKQRSRWKHLADLEAKIWGDEFRRRWKSLLADDRKRKYANSLDFIYGELKSVPSSKAAKDEKDKKRAATDSRETSEDEKRKAEELAERERLQSIFDSLTDEERQEIGKEAVAELAALWITKESDAKKKKRSVFEPMLRGKILSVTARKHG